MAKSMKVVFVTSEAVPYAKTGGLADVAGTLPTYLEKLGIDTCIIMPMYKKYDAEKILELDVELNGIKKVEIFRKDRTYFVSSPEHFYRDGLYGTPAGDYPDNCERFTLFAKSVIALLDKIEFDIVHCHDWQTGLIPLLVRRNNISAKTVFTIHNLGYQGRFPKEKFPLLGIEWDYFDIEGIEYYGDMNFLKAGIIYSDIITTVSPNYAQEIQNYENGFGLDGVLRKYNHKLFGILNGIDYSTWNPETDALIYARYSDYEGKLKNKFELTNECLFEFARPLIGMVSRIAGQKGFDILLKALDDIMALDYNIIILGFGEEEYCQRLKKFEEAYPGRIIVSIKFDETLAHRIYAGSDFFLMPSKYEPCGLGQMISLRYGTVPVVHRTGGLADTVFQYDAAAGSGNGFLFESYSAESMIQALSQARTVYFMTDKFKNLSEVCMKYDYSWNRSARQYGELYNKLFIQKT